MPSPEMLALEDSCYFHIHMQRMLVSFQKNVHLPCFQAKAETNSTVFRPLVSALFIYIYIYVGLGDYVYHAPLLRSVARCMCRRDQWIYSPSKFL